MANRTLERGEWDTELENRLACIPGASSGIGGGIARFIAKEGANVDLAARPGEKMETWA